jgi:hypothetical protein
VAQLNQLQPGSSSSSSLSLAQIRWLQGSVYPLFSPTAADLVQLCDVAQPEVRVHWLSSARVQLSGKFTATLCCSARVLPPLLSALLAGLSLQDMGSDLSWALGRGDGGGQGPPTTLGRGLGVLPSLDAVLPALDVLEQGQPEQCTVSNCS